MVNWNPEKTLLTRIDCGSISFKKLFTIIRPEKWLVGAEFLPQGNYRIASEKLPATPDYFSKQLFQILQNSFHLKSKEENREFAGFRVTLPPNLPPVFKKAADGRMSASTSEIGYSFESYSLPQLASWLETEVGVPVDYSSPPDETLYDFEIPCDFFHPKTAVDSLRKLGFVFEDAKLVRPAIVFEKE